MIWREKRVLLIILGVLLAANTIFFFTYRVLYENRLRAFDARLDEKKGQLDEARRARVAAEQQLAAYRKVEKDVRQIYDAEWSTQKQRLAPMIREVMRLAAASQLTPKSYSFDRVVTKGVKASTNAVLVGVAFSIEGTYQQVRRLINLLELSDQFMIIDRIGLSSESGAKLNLSIHVKTLFRDTAAPPRTSNQEL
ncbi:MAG TPA: hypothetical protein VGK04_00335 [Thermoanaerobaculia bacterium]